METIELKVSREDVYKEVDKTTDYTGSKLVEGDADARDRILMTDEDRRVLSRFWEETCAAANERLKEMFLSGSRPCDEDYHVCLQVSVSYDKELTPSVEASLRSFFILMVTGKWYVFTNKGEASEYVSRASSFMEDVRRKLYSRQRPRSPRHK